jgi:hypothetical protein
MSTPIVKGGQGHSPKSIEDAAMLYALCAVCAAVLLLIAIAL